jgi:asparagine synthase (glutamine-hydrolysing)
MADALMHRGPDDSGLWTDESALLALGHRRLAVIDLTEAGHQPMLSASGRWVLAYNGEVYNHMALRGQLEAKGQAPAWRGHSDTETLLACVEAWGVTETLRQSTGMFAMALWDRQERVLWLARDRIGEKPLYYGWQGDTFLFGSELKALRAHPAFNAAVDRGALALLVRHNYVPGPYSIYQGIRKLAPGTSLRIGPGQRDVEPTAYWSLAEVAEQGVARPFQGSDDEALLALEEHLGNAVRGQMMADVPLGAMLSGGIDSTAVTALMQANSARPVRTFTIGFDEKQYDEATHARAVAKHLGTEHTELRLSGNDALALVPRLATMYDEAFADSSQLPTHMVMALARKHVTVALSGDGGDEFFGGYNRYAHGPKTWNRIRWLPQPLRRAVGAGLMALPADTINHAFGGLAGRAGIALPGDKAHKLGTRLNHIRSADDLNVSLVSEWFEYPGLVLGTGMPPNLLDDRSRWPKLPDSVQRMMALDALTYLPDDIMVKVDRAAMAVSLETRAPFLDHKLVQFAWSLPMHMKLRNGQGKWLLRRLVDRHVPPALMNRPKMGFGIPLDQWLRGPLREWAESLLSEERLLREGYFDPKPIRKTWLRHQSGQASSGYRLWSVLMFQAWLENENASKELPG